MATGLAASAVTKLRELAAAVETASEAARLASTEAFTTDPLPGTGEDPWRSLFDAAKAFSMQAAYPDEEFPVVRDGAVCLWCQQPLSAAATNRLTRFQQFVVNDAATKKASADAALAAALTEVIAVNVQPFVADDTLLEELRAYKDTLAAAAEAYVLTATKRKEAILNASDKKKWDSIPPLPAQITDEIKAAADALEASALELDKADNPEGLKNLQTELVALEDRELLAKHEKDVRH